MQKENSNDNKKEPLIYSENGENQSLFYKSLNYRTLIYFKIQTQFECKTCKTQFKLEFTIRYLFPFCKYCKTSELLLLKRSFLEQNENLESHNKFDNHSDRLLKYFVISLIWEIRNESMIISATKKLKIDSYENYEKKYNSISINEAFSMVYFDELKNKIFESNDFNLFRQSILNNYSLEDIKKAYLNIFKNLFENNTLFKYLFNEINYSKKNIENIKKNLENISTVINKEATNKNNSIDNDSFINFAFLNDSMTNKEKITEKENEPDEMRKFKSYDNKTINTNDENLKELIDEIDLYIPENDEYLEDSIDELDLKNDYSLLNNSKFNPNINENNNNSSISIQTIKYEIKNDDEFKNEFIEDRSNKELEPIISTLENKKYFEQDSNFNKDLNLSRSINSHKSDLVSIENQKIIKTVTNNFKELQKKEEKLKIEITEKNWENDNDSYSISRRSFLKLMNNNRVNFSKADFEYLIKLDEIQYKTKLRIYGFKYDIIKSLIENEITIVVSEPGSGKTTQIVQYCLNMKFNSFINRKPIWCTQPRKISCISVSERVSDEISDSDYKIVKTLIRFNYEIYNDKNLNLSAYDKNGENITSSQQIDYLDSKFTKFNSRIEHNSKQIKYKNEKFINTENTINQRKINSSLKLNNIEEETRIIFSTENILLNELIEDPYLSKVNILIIDEAHERSLNLDIILYFLKNYTLKRDDFRLIITSATLNYKQFYNYFKSFKYEVINQIEHDFMTLQESLNNDSSHKEKQTLIKSKKYHVNCHYSNVEIDEINLQSKTINFLSSLLSKELIKIEENVKRFIPDNSKNDSNLFYGQDIEYNKNNFLTILVFLPDTKSILHLKNYFTNEFSEYINKNSFYIFQLYGSLDFYDQNQIISFYAENSVKLILSTNIAETSVTIPYCNIVVDTGLQKVRRYNYETKLLEDNIELISKDSAFQRQGRCGRIDKGDCYKLYTKEQFESMNEFRIAEICRVNISYMILKLIYFGISNVFNVRLIEQPSNEDILFCIKELMVLNAIEKIDVSDQSIQSFRNYKKNIDENNEEFFEQNNQIYETTDFGNWLYKIELEPAYGRVVYDCINNYKVGLNEILMIISSITFGDRLISIKKKPIINKNSNFPSFIDFTNVDVGSIINKYGNFEDKEELKNRTNNLVFEEYNRNKEKSENEIKFGFEFNINQIEERIMENTRKYIDCVVQNIFAEIILSYKEEETYSYPSINQNNQTENANYDKKNENERIIHNNIASIYNNSNYINGNFEDISNNCMKIITKNNIFLEYSEELIKFFEVYKILNRYFNSENYFIDNLISSLGDMMIGIFCIRQFQKMSCLKHFDYIKENRNFHHVFLDDLLPKSQRGGFCRNCIRSKYSYIRMYNLDLKNLNIQMANYKNLKKILESFYKCPLKHLCLEIYGLSLECAELEYILANWNSIYNLLFLENFQNVFNFYNKKIDKILVELRNTDFKNIFFNVYKYYKELYLRVIGPSFFKVFSYNISFKPFIAYYENNKRKRLNILHELNDNYLHINMMKRCKLDKNSIYKKYFSFLDWKKENEFYIGNKDIDEFNFLVFSIQLRNLNEINLKNVNPIFPSMLNGFKKNVLIDLKNLYQTKGMHVFSISNIGPYFINYLQQRRKNLEKSENFNSNQSENALLKMIFFNFNGNRNSINFITDNASSFKKDQAYIMNLISNERKNIKENFIEEIGYLNQDCLILKIKHGFQLVNIEFNKDPIHFKVVLNEDFHSLQNFAYLLKNKNYKYNKIYFYRNNIYISFKNSNQANMFSQIHKTDDDLADKFSIVKISEDMIYSNDDQGYNNRNVLSVIVDRELDTDSILTKLNKFGDVKDLIVKNVNKYTHISFIMSSNYYTNKILTRFRAHEDEFGKWSDVKMIQRFFDIYIDGKFSISNESFWNEFNKFTSENGIEYTNATKNKISIKNFTDNNIRKVLSYLAEDVIQLCDFSLMEIKLNSKYSFYGKLGMTFKDFCQFSKVYLEFFHYMKK